MAEVQYTREELIEGLRKAVANGNNRAANEIADVLASMEEKDEQLADPGMFPEFTKAAQVTGERLAGLAGTPEEKALGQTPGVFRIASEIAGGTGRLLMGAAKDITPDIVEEAVSRNVQGLTDIAKERLTPVIKLATLVSETDMAQEVLNTIQQSWSSHLSRKADDPEYALVAKELEALIDVGLLVAPGPKLKPVVPKQDSFLEKLGIGSKEAGTQQTIRKRKELTQKALTPIDGFGQGTTSTRGWLKRKTYDPTTDELEMIDIISGIPEFNPNTTFINNYNVVEDYIGRQANRLTAGISKAGNPKINVEALVEDIRTRALQGLADEVYNRKGKAKKIEDQLKLFGERLGEGTALEVLEARKALDAALRRDSNSADDSIATPSKAGRRAIAEAVHEAIAAAIPDLEVQNLLRSQALAYRARDIFDEKRRLEADTLISRMGQNISKAGVNLPRNPASQVATGNVAANTITSGVFPYILGVAGTAATVYGLGKAAFSAQTKKFLGSLLLATDKAIKVAKGSPQMIQQLKADRALLVALMQDARFDEVEEQEKEEQE
jgi:hypothetical protein